jgi:3-methyladenine DNA glycosylase AlkD
LTNIASISTEIDERLRARANPDRKRVALTYFPTAMEVVGVAVPDLRAVVRDIARRLRGASAQEVLKLAQAVIDASTFEGRQVAFEVLARHAEAMAALTAESIERLGRGIDNWASVDTFAVTIAGPAWREGQLGDDDVRRWANSPDRWWRRAAVVSTVAFNQKSRGGRGDTARTVAICEIVADDHDEMVAKALSWALRALSVVDRQAVMAFLDRHEAELPSRVRREVSSKLTTGLKGKRRPVERDARPKRELQ